MKDRLTPELRKAEKEIDYHYRSNPLVQLPFATAAWSLLAFGEEVVLKEQNDGRKTQLVSDENTSPILAVRPRQLTSQEYEALADNLVNNLKYSMHWLYSACEPGGQTPSTSNGNVYKASWDLFKLAQEYRWFTAAYVHASHGWIKLRLEGSTIQPSENLFTDIEYEAYNRLIKPHKLQEASSSVNIDNFPMDAIRRSLKIEDERFSYKLNPRMICDTITAKKPIFDEMFLLPSEWQLSHYTLGDFRKVFEAISAIASIQAIARRMAIAQQCLKMGYADSIYMRPFDDLVRQVVRYSGVSGPEVRSIFDDLSYGNRGISNPDPALQPLIKLNSDTYAVMPHLWLFSSAERNLTVLLNKLPSEKEIYSKLVDEKEVLMRNHFITGLSDTDFRFIWGKVQDLPDVDLAIIRDSEKTCLLLELKWFIDPAEAREIIEKSEEIEKGISQVLQLTQAFASNHTPLLKKLQIDSSYTLEGVVASENWIGHAKAQSPEIPVIQANHLIEKLKATKSLESAMEWLKDRKYLPKEGEHFKVHITTHTIGDWSLKWYEIQPLIADAFFPL